MTGAIIAKLQTLGVPHRLEISPYTGQLTVYVQSIAPTVINHQTPPNLDALKNHLTDELVAQTGADAYCDAVTYIGGAVTDNYLSSVWAAVAVTADGNLAVLDTTGSLGILWSELAEALILLLNNKAFWTFLGLVVVLAIAYVVIGYLGYQPQYAYPDLSGNPTTGTWTQYISTQNAKYWFVCSKDGFGTGERALYASPADVPDDQINLFNEHCTNASDISPKDRQMPDWIWWIVIPVVAIGGVYIAAKVLPGLLKKKES